MNTVTCILLKPEKFLIILIYLLPWAYVYKFSFFSTSLFVILVMISSIIFVIRNKKLNKNFIFIILLLLMYLLIGISDISGLMYVIKLIFSFILLYFMIKSFNCKNFKKVFIFFTISILITSIIALLLQDTTILADRIDIEKHLVDYQYARFTGLANDPNYYNLNVVLALFGLIYLFVKKEIKFTFLLTAVPLSYFGMITYSKSFMLLFIVLLIYFSILLIKSKRIIITVIMLLVMIVFVIIALMGRIDAINIIVGRFNEGGVDITTGRTSIYQIYLSYIFKNWFVFLFGSGLSNILLDGHAAHNTYIDLIYYFGILGTILYMYGLYTIFSKTNCKNNIYGMMILSILLVAYFFLSEVITVELVFHLFIVWLFFRVPNDTNVALKPRPSVINS